MPVKDFWSLQAGDDHTDLYLQNEIASYDSWWDDVETPQRFRRQLNAAHGELRVWLNSPGGDAFAGNAIYDMIREYASSGRGRTVAMVSLAASAASIIAMACDEIRISILGTIMIHEPWSVTAGPAREHMATAKVLETIRDAQIDAYVKRTGQTREKVLELLQGPDGNGTYMNASMAVELGFADSVIDGDNGAEAASLARSLQSRRIQSAIRHAAENLEAAAKNHAEPEGAPNGDAEAARRLLMQTCLTTY